MKTPKEVPLAKTAVLTIAEIRSAAQAFDRGEANVFDALDVIVVAVEAYRAATAEKPGRKRAERKAA